MPPLTFTILRKFPYRQNAQIDLLTVSIYQLAFSSYALAGVHFVSEWLVFGTAKLGKGLMGPLIVSSVSMVWMLTQWNYYVPA
jgi:hypothetical protein